MAEEEDIFDNEFEGISCKTHPALIIANQHTFSFVTAKKLPKGFFLCWTFAWGIFNFTNLFLEFFYFGEADTKGRLWFIYIENWAFFLLVMFAVVDFAVTVSAFTLNKKLMEEENMQIPWYIGIQRVLYRLSTTCYLAVCIAYFSLQKDDSLHAFLKVAVPGCYIFLNMFISAKPFLLSSVYIPMVFTIIYAVFSVIYQTQGGGLIYDLFLINWEKYPYTAVGFALGVVLVGIPFFDSIVYLFYALITLNCCQKSYVEPETESIVAISKVQDLQRENTTVNIFMISESDKETRDRLFENINSRVRLLPINAASNFADTEDRKPIPKRKKKISPNPPPPIHSDDSEGDEKTDEIGEVRAQTFGNNSLTGLERKTSNDNDDTQTENSDTEYKGHNDKGTISSSHYTKSHDNDEESGNSIQMMTSEYENMEKESKQQSTSEGSLDEPSIADTEVEEARLSCPSSTNKIRVS